MPEVSWSVDPAAEVPPFRQLVDVALDAVARGDLAAGDQLPPVRGLAGRVLVNHNTITKAYRELERLGVVVGRNGLGVFVTARAGAIARGERRAATLRAYRQSLFEALRAGHDASDLRRLVDDLSQECA